MSQEKSELIAQMQSLLNDKIESASDQLADAIESRNSDTKSSAGDKFETGRAMVQMEIDKIEKQLALYRQMRATVDQIKPDHIHKVIGQGSLVETNVGRYFLAIPLGKIPTISPATFAISLASPIGQLLAGKSVGDEINFNGSNQKVIAIS